MSDSAEMASYPGRTIMFASFNVTTHVFHITPHSFAIVNLKPLLPGHILVCPIRIKPLLSDLTKDELFDLFSTVTRIQKTLRRVYKVDAFNVAMQDGPAAGQTVPHVHCHVIPRTEGDPGSDDKIYEWLEGEEGNIGGHLKMDEEIKMKKNADRFPKDEDRKARTEGVMAEEAKWLREEMAKDEGEEGGRL